MSNRGARNSFTKLVHLMDDGRSGTRWGSPAFLKTMDEIERGNAGETPIVDMGQFNSLGLSCLWRA